ncbi:MAG TPA: HlyD family efflux transporter periplasmic adaptor subunit [Gemmataceae bacterium]|nr:HlyD family efflux transporter periplasmic adaptor subunit [Gemmataceae bacterium]
MSIENGRKADGAAQTVHDFPMNNTPLDLPVIDHTAGAKPAAAAPAVAPPKPKASRLPVWRFVRRGVGAALVVAALWWLVVPLLFPVTSQAVVNARMVQVRAPIDGAAGDIFHDIGDVVQAGDPLLKVVSSRADTSHLAELTARRSMLAAQRERVASDLETATRTREECRAATRRFYKELVSSLKDSLAEAEARAEAARLGTEAAHVRTARAVRLAVQQVGADSDLDAVRADESVAVKQYQQVEAARAKLEKELHAAEQGFLFQRDAPSFEQRADDLDAKIPQMQAELKETEDKLAAADKELQDEQRRVDRLSEAAVASPVSGAVWKRNGEPGQAVKQQENLLEIADRDTIFVEALLPQSHLNTIAAGCRAVVRLTDGRVLNGHVRAVRTLGGSDTEASFAINLPCPDVKEVRVLIDFDPGIRDAALIGRHARVLIVDEHPGPCQQVMMWLFGWVGV